jgi:hypothetical protein
LKLFVLLLGIVLVVLSAAGLALRPVVARTGQSPWDWRLALPRSEPIHDAYYVVAPRPVSFAILLLAGLAACAYYFTATA